MRILLPFALLAGGLLAQPSPVVVPFYGNAKCPVCSKDSDRAVYLEHEGQRVYFASKACKAEAKGDPTQALAKAYPADRVHVLKLEVCPIMGKPVKADQAVVWQGRRIPFCCSRCAGVFKKEPNKRMALIENPARRELKNTHCPVMAEEAVIPDVFVIYKDQIVNLCCDSCEDEFKADPEKFMKALAGREGPKPPAPGGKEGG
jgi:YHS domain-containing protein